jgi:restriction endonuclease S subunit
MNKTRKKQAEKLQAKLDTLLQTREKKQKAFEKSKQELNTVNKNVETVKLKLFEILQSGSDDTAFSNWAKRKIVENSKAEKANSVNLNSANIQKPITQNPQPHTGQSTNPHQPQDPNKRH